MHHLPNLDGQIQCSNCWFQCSNNIGSLELISSFVWHCLISVMLRRWQHERTLGMTRTIWSLQSPGKWSSPETLSSGSDSWPEVKSPSSSGSSQKVGFPSEAVKICLNLLLLVLRIECSVSRERPATVVLLEWGTKQWSYICSDKNIRLKLKLCVITPMEWATLN